MSKMDDRLNEILGIGEVGGSLSDQLDGLTDEGAREPFAVVTYEPKESKVIEAPVNEDALEDYKYSREILYGLIQRGTSALEGVLMVAKESEHPRAYETATNMMKSISDMTKDLLQLQKVLVPASGKNTIQAKTVNVQNNNYATNREEPIDPDAGLFDMLDDLDDK